MAWLPAGPNGPVQITEIGDGTIAIIENPGTDLEKVLFKYNGFHPHETNVVKNNILESDKLTPEQKFYAGFWMGYFYAYLSGSYRTFSSNFGE